MSFFRTSRHSDYQFLLEITRTPEEANAIISANYRVNDVFHNYLCGLPVDDTCITRFGYKNCKRRPLYICEIKETSLLEYAYWVLKNPHELDIGPIRAYLYIVDMEIKKDFHNLTTHPDLNLIMDIKDIGYSNAHMFMKNFENNLPDYIIYPSIRTTKSDSLNFGYFSGEINKFSIISILTILKDNKKPKDSIFMMSNDGIINGFFEPVKM